MATEKRLIDRNEIFPNGTFFANAEDPLKSLDELIKRIWSIPTVDAVEVVHAHWCWEGKFKACSKCGSYVEWDETLGANFWNFCPFCGAKMDGDGND